MRPALLLALLAGCGLPVVHTINEAKKLEPEKAVPKDSKDSKDSKASKAAPATDASAPPIPSPAPRTDIPFKRAGEAASQRDDFTFWGWSADNTRYAFELHDHGPGATACEGSYTLYVVDATRDAFVAGTPLVVEHRRKDDAVCDPPDLAAEIEKLRPPALAQHGIVVDNQRPPTLPRRISTSTGRESSSAKPAWILTLGPGSQLRAELENRHGGRDKAGEPGGAYHLTLTRDGEAPRVIESGERRRPFVWHYDLDGGLVFLAPDGRHLALFVATTRLSFEGDRHSLMSNAVALPPTWIPGAPN